MKEIWGKIPNFSRYEVSNKGRVRSFIQKNFQGRILKLDSHFLGYTTIRIVDDEGNGYHTFVHRLMAIVFIPNPLNKPHINHIDGNPKNNNLNNLEWCTHKENMEHKVFMGTSKNAPKGEQCRQSKFTEQQVLKIRERSSKGEMRVVIAKDYGVTPEAISHIALRKNWKHI